MEPRIVAVYEARSEVFKDNKRIFKPPPSMGNKIFPLRIKLKLVKDFLNTSKFQVSHPETQVHQEQAEMDRSFDGKAMREIPEEDYNLIMGVAE